MAFIATLGEQKYTVEIEETGEISLPGVRRRQ